MKEVESQVKEQFDRRTIRLEVSGRVLVGEFFTVLQGKRVFGKRKIESIRQFIKDAVRAETEPRPVRLMTLLKLLAFSVLFVGHV